MIHTLNPDEVEILKKHLQIVFDAEWGHNRVSPYALALPEDHFLNKPESRPAWAIHLPYYTWIALALLPTEDCRAREIETLYKYTIIKIWDLTDELNKKYKDLSNAGKNCIRQNIEELEENKVQIARSLTEFHKSPFDLTVPVPEALHQYPFKMSLEEFEQQDFIISRKHREWTEIHSSNYRKRQRDNRSPSDSPLNSPPHKAPNNNNSRNLSNDDNNNNASNNNSSLATRARITSVSSITYEVLDIQWDDDDEKHELVIHKVPVEITFIAVANDFRRYLSWIEDLTRFN